MKSLFVYDPQDVKTAISGGVQLCSQEFLSIVRAASESSELFPVHITRFLPWRIRRRLGLGGYLYYRPTEIESNLRNAARNGPSHVFLNRSELLRLAPVVRNLLPEAKVVLMSHGNQSGDDLYEVAGHGGRRTARLTSIAATWRLGQDLVTESRFRHLHLDGVCVMSNEEETLERWLGARRTLVIPRIVSDKTIDWLPKAGRAGFVGTLNHTPNRIALEQLCASLVGKDLSGFELRLVGGPESVGRDFSTRWPFVKYLGQLDDKGLLSEASSWALFLNPIFWLSRGASMKLGQAISWGLPTISTRSGARGYRIGSGEILVTLDNPDCFALELLRVIRDSTKLSNLRKLMLDGACNRPSALSLATEMRDRAVSLRQNATP